MPKISKIEIPFPVIRLLLPADGEIISHILKKDTWKDKTKPFFRHESIELAFGRKIRAKMKDRKLEKWWRPGMEAKGNFILIKGGWRAHKKVKFHDDFFDGTFTARLTLNLKQKVLEATASNLDFTWNKSTFGDIANLLTFGKLLPALEKKLENQVQNEINKFLSGDFRKLFDEFIDKDPRLKDLRKRSTLSIKGNNLFLSVQTD